jgi:hypothetical protein
MKITGSPDISVLSIRVIFDISGVTPIIYLENESQGNNLSGVQYSFSVVSPTQTYIKEGNINTPDITGIWSDFTIGNAWPRPFNNIEWSGAPYVFQATVRDSNGNVFVGEAQQAFICRPNGNLPTSQNTYGKGSVLVQVKCDQAGIYFQDTTSASYRGIDGQIGSSVLKVNFPMDNTGTVPAPFIGNNFSTALVPVTYSGKGYQFLFASVYQYDFEENVSIRIKYVVNDTFGVWCNIDLMPLLCEYQKLIESIETGNCANVEEASQRLMLMNPKFSLLVMGMFQPLLGIDVPALIEEIKEIGGFDCDCCNVATGVVPVNSSIIDGYNFTVVPLGGDVQGAFVQNGNNIQLQISDVKYIFKICDSSPADSEAFTVVPSVSGDGYTKTYCLSVDLPTLSEEILNTIASDAALVNLFNSIVTTSGDGSFNLIVDGGCIFSSSASCDYTFTMTSIPASGTFAILSSIQTASANINVNQSFNLTTLAALQTYFNGLGIGTFTVANPAGQTVVISSTSNTNNILQVLYKNPNITVAAMTKDCTGYVPLSANQVVQNIITYLCSLSDTQIVTSAQYQICYIDPATNTSMISTVSAGVSLAAFISELLNAGCKTISYIQNLGAVNCQTIKRVFGTPSGNSMQPNDYFLATKQGACAPVNPVEAFLTMLTYGANNTAVVQAFCEMVQLCSGGFPCAPYNVFYAEIQIGSPSTSSDLVVTFSHPDAISNTIRYARIDNTNSPVYITVPNVLPGASPYTISGVANGQYRVYIRPIYADGRLCSETVFDTPACSGINAFSASYDGTNINVTYNVSMSVPEVRVVVNYPNGGSSTTLYNNGDSISIAPPPNVFGTFLITLQAVCDSDTGFFSTSTSPATVVISSINSSIFNNAGETLSLVYVNLSGIGIVASASMANGASVNFNVPDGTYPTITIGITDLPVTPWIVTLTNSSGTTYFATQISAFAWQFANLTIVDGCQIVIYPDSSSPVGFGDFIIDNQTVSGLIINTVTPAVYDIGVATFPVGSGEIINGTHAGFNTDFQVSVTSSGAFTLASYKNDILVQSIPITTSGTYNLTTVVSCAPSDKFEIRVS